MTALKKGIFCLIIFLSHIILSSQTLSFNRYTTSDGLLSDEVYNLHQDKDGYIWMFTNYGVLKYNSLEFKPVLRNLPFKESFIYCIYENKKGQKWVANSRGKIYEVIHDSAFVVKGTESVSEKLNDASDEIGQLYVDDSLNIYTTTKHYTYKFVRKGNTHYPVNISKHVKNDSVIYKVLKKENILVPIYNYQEKDINYWFTRKGRVGMLLPSNDPSGYSFYGINLSKKGATRFFKQYGKDIYFTVYDQFCKLSGNTVHYWSFNSFINNFVKDKNGHTWVACLNGIYELNEKDSVIHHYLENITVNDLLIDSQGGFWASSSGQGLFHYENMDNLYFKENELLASPIRFMKTLDGRLFIATVNGDLFMVKDAKISLILQEKDAGSSLLNIVKYRSNYLVSSVYRTKEIHVKDNGKTRVVATHKKIINALKIMPGNNDTLIFLGRKGFGTIYNMTMLKRMDFSFKTYDCVPRENDYLIATDKGIHIWNKVFNTSVLRATGDYLVFYDSLIRPDYLLPSRNSVIKKITMDSLHRWWFNSIGDGLFILDSSNYLRHLTVTDGLPSNIINDISFSPDGSVVLCTNKGLFISPGKNGKNQAYVWNKIYPGEVENARVFEKKIYLGTKKGLVILNYKEIKEREGINFNLNSVYLNSTEVNTNHLREIAYNQNNMEFKFDVISFSNDRPDLKYYLYGPVADSGSVTGTTIKLLNLSPGNYSLTTFPNINRGEALKIIIPFNIIPAWWQTTAFFVFLILFILLVMILSLWLIMRSARKKREQKEKAERLILEYKLIALKAQINPHFMSNCLSAIQLLIIHNKVDAATHYIARFGLLVRQILNFSTRSLVLLKEELEITSLNIELEQLRFENKFRFEVLIDEQLDPKKIFVPALIMNPIIENAIWHGLLPLKGSRPGKLLIEIKKNSDTLVLIVEDNGVGRQSDRQKIGNTRQSKGIQLTEQRLSNINYLYNITTAQLVFSYLSDEHESKNGARVTISLPLNLTPLQNE